MIRIDRKNRRVHVEAEVSRSSTAPAKPVKYVLDFSNIDEERVWQEAAANLIVKCAQRVRTLEKKQQGKGYKWLEGQTIDVANMKTREHLTDEQRKLREFKRLGFNDAQIAAMLKAAETETSK